MIILVDGLPAAGKATLKGLLDGHSQIFTGYNHDMIADTICDTDNSLWLDYKDVLYLRSLLATTHYYQLEYFAYKKSTVIVMKADQNNRFDIDFDFYNMDRTFMEKILPLKSWDCEAITKSLFQSMMESGPYPPNKTDIKHFVSMGYNRAGICEKFISAYPSGKILYMLRPIEQIVAVLSNRTPADDDMWSMILLQTTVKSLVEHGYVQKLRSSEKYIRAMAKKHPDKVKLISFEELVLNTKSVMHDVVRWLGVPYEEVLQSCTLAGNEMRTEEGRTFIGEILDNVEELISPEERAIIALEISLKNFFLKKEYRNLASLSFVLKVRMKRTMKKVVDTLLGLFSASYREACRSHWQRNGFW